MAKRRRNRKTVPVKVMESAIAVSSRQLLDSGAKVLIARWGFSDKEAAEWIEATFTLASGEARKMAAVMEQANERLRDEQTTNS